MSNILVTGGAGFIGSNYVYYHIKNNPNDKIIVLDSLTYAGCKDFLSELKDNNNFTFIQGDITDKKLLRYIFNDFNILKVINFAAETHVDNSIKNPEIFIKTNIEGTLALLLVAKEFWIKDQICYGHFHHISTDEVYGTLGLDDLSFTENNQYKPNSPYSASKAAADHLVRAFVKTYGLNATITNCSNNYGPRQFPEKLIPLTITSLLLGKNIPIYGDGKQIRDWLFVDDHAKAIDLILNSNFKEGHWNIGGKNELTNIVVVKTICDLLDLLFKNNIDLKNKFPKCPPALGQSCHSKITFVADRPGHDRRYSIDPSLAEKELGFRPSTEFNDGILITINWYLENYEWWSKLV